MKVGCPSLDVIEFDGLKSRSHDEGADERCEEVGVGFGDGERSTDEIVPVLVIGSIRSGAGTSGVGRLGGGRARLEVECKPRG